MSQGDPQLGSSIFLKVPFEVCEDAPAGYCQVKALIKRKIFPQAGPISTKWSGEVRGPEIKGQSLLREEGLQRTFLALSWGPKG